MATDLLSDWIDLLEDGADALLMTKKLLLIAEDYVGEEGMEELAHFISR